jgi:hypothetical protein
MSHYCFWTSITSIGKSLNHDEGGPVTDLGACVSADNSIMYLFYISLYSVYMY